jgi:tetratricopeptide (TPR) repeat protein
MRIRGRRIASTLLTLSGQSSRGLMTTATPNGTDKAGPARRETTQPPRPVTPGALALVPGDDEVLRATTTVRLAPGRRVPGTRYRIVRWLGEGGMGVIYEVEHLDVQRRLALKVLREEASHSPGAAAELRREARTASQVGSPYIIEVFDLGTLPDGRLFVALELVEGQDLFEDVANAPMAIDRLIAVLRQVCKGLGDAHEAGILHRDVKPENVLLGRRDGRRDAVKLVDFGVSRVMNSARVETHAVGTPVYMAPECWTGEATDHRVDIYGVGITAYELLAGVPPCDGETRDVMMFHLDGEPPPLAEKRPGLTVPPEIEAIIMKCLAKKPEDRYADTADLEAALCEAQIALGIETPWDDLPLPDVDEKRRDRLLRRMPSHELVAMARARHRWWLGAMLGATVALGGVGLYALFRDSEPTAAEQSVVTDLVHEAQVAAARAYYVYPPEETDEETAYRRVLELERLEGAPAGLGREQAEELRSEFAATLVRLGDRYWERDGGRVFAVDYYAQALVFDASHPRASERSPLTLAELAELRRKASALDFTDDERQAVTPLMLLAADNEEAALSALQAYFAEDQAASLSRDANVERLLRSSGRRPEVGKRRAAEAGAQRESLAAMEVEIEDDVVPPIEVLDEPDEVPVEPDPTVDASPDHVLQDPPDEAAHEAQGNGRAPADAPKQDAEGAAQLVKEARAAARAGNKTRAESLFHQALGKNGRSSEALIGLSNLYFEQANYYRAMGYATKAVKRSPKTASYRILLGDAYFKLLRYADARQQYEWAKRLGHPGAARRLEKVDKKLGSR